MERIGERIENLRYKNNLTLEDLSKHLGISKTAIRKYETGATKNIKYENIEKLANLFNVSTDYLLNGKQEETPEYKFIKLLLDKTLENKIHWIDLKQNIKIQLKDSVIKYDRVVEILDAFIPPNKSIHDGYKIKLTSINDKIIIFKYDKSEECQELIYGTSTYINSIEDYGFNNELLTKLCLYLFEPVIYNKNNSISSLIDDLENL